MEFTVAMEERLSMGHTEYGDGSFSQSPNELLGEMREEALDIVGWGYILWCRLRELEAALDKTSKL